MMRARIYSDFEALPPGYGALFAQSATESFCLTRWWFETLAHDTMGESERLRLFGVESGAPEPTALALLVARQTERGASTGWARTLSSLSNYYTMVFAPSVTNAVDQAQALAVLFDAIDAQRPRYDLLRFQPLDPESPLYLHLQVALHAAGFVVQPFFHFDNLYENTKGISFQTYWKRRPSALRNMIERKGGKLGRTGQSRLDVITGQPELERGITDYERVYEGSWKPAEPYQGVIRNLARSCAGEGALRLGLIYLDGEPVAAQIWIVWNGVATLYKLAHDRRYDRCSPGTILTMRMVRHVIDVDRVEEIDFGAGGDPYKKLWTSERRERWGLVGYNRRTIRGFVGSLRVVSTTLRPARSGKHGPVHLLRYDT